MFPCLIVLIQDHIICFLVLGIGVKPGLHSPVATDKQNPGTDICYLIYSQTWKTMLAIKDDIAAVELISRCTNYITSL